ncbi:MAG: DUF1684 domain-containing protein [Microbacteriaceae bacterium]
MTNIETPEELLADFRSHREHAVTAPTGTLALVNTQWVTAEQVIYGVPGRWAPLPAGQSGLTVIATAADSITVDGVLVDGEVRVRGRDSRDPSSVSFSDTVTGFVIADAAGHYALRVWDSDSEGIREFGGIDAFPYNPDWVVTATIAETPAGSVSGYEDLEVSGVSGNAAVPAEVTFTRDGIGYRLTAVKVGPSVRLIFTDATSGAGSYDVGRFLSVDAGPGDSLTLDFNRALLPPCAFSYSFNCPLTPPQNRLAVPVMAGEKNVLKKDGSLLHD